MLLEAAAGGLGVLTGAAALLVLPVGAAVPLVLPVPGAVGLSVLVGAAVELLRVVAEGGAEDDAALSCMRARRADKRSVTSNAAPPVVRLMSGEAKGTCKRKCR